MHPTLRDIADRTQYSLATVAKVLGKKSGSFRPQTREKIECVARELGYRPKLSAISMRSGKTDTLCLLQSVLAYRSLVSGDVLEGIQSVILENNLHLTLAQLPDEKLANEGFVPRILTELACDGLLVNYNTQVPDRMIEMIEQFRLPAVWINAKRASNCVYPNDVKAGQMAGEYLLSQGFRSLVYLDLSNSASSKPSDCHYSTLDRFEGVRRAASDLTVRHVVADSTVRELDRMAYCRQWLRDNPGRHGVVAYAAWEARAMAAACLSMGLEIGHDIGLVTIHETPVCDLGFMLDTVVLPGVQMGRLATQMLMDILKCPGEEQSAVVLSPRLQRGNYRHNPERI
jgi:LacI family transcriptional regulator